MKKLLQFLLLIYFLFVGINNILAQINQTGGYRAIHWGQEAGLLKERWHNGIIKDKKGMMWFGSSHGEISCFDGNSFRQLHPKAAGSTSPYLKVVQCIIEDSLNNLWMGTAGGLLRFNIRTEMFDVVDAKTDSGGNNIAYGIFWATKNEVYAFENGTKIVSFDIRNFKKKEWIDLSAVDEIFPVSFSLHYSVFDVAAQTVWILLKRQEGLAEVNLLTKKVTIHPRKPESMYRAADFHPDTEAMVFDSKRNAIWMNSHDGLYFFGLNDRRFHRVEAVIPLVKKGNYNRWVGIDIDREGKVWFAAAPEGLMIYEPETKRLTKAFTDPQISNDVSSFNLKIYCDRENIVWLSYWGNNEIYQVVPYHPSITQYTAKPGVSDSLNNVDIVNMVPADDGTLWMGTYNGINIFDPVKKRFHSITTKDIPGTEGDAIVPMMVKTKENKAWFNAGPDDQIFEMNIAERKATPLVFRNMNGEKVKPINVIQYLTRPFKKGFLTYDGGHGILDYQGDSLVAKVVIPFSRTIFRMEVVEDSLLFLYTPGFNTGNITYALRNGGWILIDHPSSSIGWKDMLFNKADKSFWVSVENSILHYDHDFKLIRTYKNIQLQPASLIYSMVYDGRKYIWFCDDKRNITVLDIVSGAFYTLTQQDGFHKLTFDFYSAEAVSAGDDIYFSGSLMSRIPNVFMHIRSAEFNYPPSDVYLNGISVNQKPFPFEGNLVDSTDIQLKYFQNKIDVHAGILDFFSRGGSSLRYRMEGEDSTWHIASYYQTISYEELPPKKYNLLLQASNSANQFNGPVRKLHITIHPAFWDTWWFRLPVAALLLFIGYLVVRRSVRLKYKKRLERAEKERQIAELKQKSSEHEMQALRAQMNPHFIFNSLNSINRFILQNNRLQASEYLTKFSRLIRLILQNSQSAYITMENELESLRLYLELEALRFDYRFSYKISVDDNADISMLQVPSLMIQPYVENAIWHGLMHKEGKGELDIEVSQEEKYVFIRVADNGIGRKQAAALSSKSATKHKSMGLQITEHRIAMMHSENGLESPVTFHDLENEDGTAAGTEVIIKIPVMYD